MSHPSWVCGLKHLLVMLLIMVWLVTPFVGVWIETAKANDMRAAGLVTPFVGVWIETLYPIFVNQWSGVTPFVGVWIETVDASVSLQKSQGHTLRGCVD